MIPDGVLSTQLIKADLMNALKEKRTDTLDYDFGPVALTDTSGGLMAENWQGYSDGGNIYYSIVGSDEKHFVTTVSNVEEISITFDQNARPCFAWWDGAVSHLYWYDTVNQQFSIMDLPGTTYNPRVNLDDKRSFNVSNSDIIFAYINGDNLCVRYQRERYETEHVLATVGHLTRLVSMSMNEVLRLQFHLQKPIAAI